MAKGQRKGNCNYQISTLDELPGTLQIAAFWRTCDSRPKGYNVTSSALKLLLVLVQRPNEVYQMNWEEIRGEWWYIRGGKEGRTKNELEHRVYLPPLAREILGRVKSAEERRGYVFPSPRKSDGSPITVTGMSSVYNDLCRAAGIPCEPKPWGPHGLRRTGSTKLSELGFSDEIVDAVTNHVKRGVRRNYNLNAYLPEKQRSREAEGHAGLGSPSAHDHLGVVPTRAACISAMRASTSASSQPTVPSVSR